MQTVPKTKSPKVENKPLVKSSQKLDNDLDAKSAFVSPPDIRMVTSLNLLRTHVTGSVKHAKIIFADSAYREVVIAGLRNGVVWDEIIRALVDRELSSIEPFAGLKNFLPESPSYVPGL